MYPMSKDISIKELRQRLSEIASNAEKGETYRVIRRSKPSFAIMKIDGERADDEWETVVDFTEGGKKTGVPLSKVLKTLRKLQK